MGYRRNRRPSGKGANANGRGTPGYRELTSEDRAEYVASGGVRCPLCGSGAIEGGSMHANAGEITQEVGCSRCEFRWTDVYVLVGIWAHGPGVEGDRAC